MAIDTDLFLAKLNGRKRELQELSEISAQDRQVVSLDQQSVGRLSRMDALQRQAMAEAQERQRAQELVRIEQALRRLADGEFGYCMACGEEIAEGRLNVDPAATHCITCAGAR